MFSVTSIFVNLSETMAELGFLVRRCSFSSLPLFHCASLAIIVSDGQSPGSAHRAGTAESQNLD